MRGVVISQGGLLGDLPEPGKTFACARGCLFKTIFALTGRLIFLSEVLTLPNIIIVLQLSKWVSGQLPDQLTHFFASVFA